MESLRPCRGIHGHLSNRAGLLQLRVRFASLLLLRALPAATTTGTAASRLLRRETRGAHGGRGHLQHRRLHLAPLRRLDAGPTATRSQMKTRSQRLQRVTPGLLIHVIHGHRSQRDRQQRAEDRARLLHPLRRLATRGQQCRRGRRRSRRLHLALRRSHPAGRRAMTSRTKTRGQRLQRETRGPPKQHGLPRREAGRGRRLHPP